MKTFEQLREELEALIEAKVEIEIEDEDDEDEDEDDDDEDDDDKKKRRKKKMKESHDDDPNAKKVMSSDNAEIWKTNKGYELYVGGKSKGYFDSKAKAQAAI